MSTPGPFIREGGEGPGVVCIHSNASSSSQWRTLLDVLAPSYKVVAPDCYGSGKSPDWHSDRRIALRDEVAFLEPAFARAGETFSIVGHSYGAAVALMAAIANPGRVGALALYEPTLFSIVDARHPRPNGADGIRSAVAASGKALDDGDADLAAACFIDFWMASGTWNSMPAERKPAIRASIVNVRRWAYALVSEPTPLTAFESLDIPVLYMLGDRSPESAQAVARILAPALPRAEVVIMKGFGHMAPVTHPESVNAQISRFLAKAWPSQSGHAHVD